jgi:transcriptional regulator with XRE-family HTH domain
MKQLRGTLGMTQEELCAILEISQNRYAMYESGMRPLTLEVAARIALKTGVTLDWLYFGASAGLPLRFAKLA